MGVDCCNPVCLTPFNVFKQVSFGGGPKSADMLLFSLIFGLLWDPKFKMLIENVGDTRCDVPAIFSTSGLTGCPDPDLKIEDNGMVDLAVASFTELFDMPPLSHFLCDTGSTIAFVFLSESFGTFGMEKVRFFIPVALVKADVPGATFTLIAGLTVMADLTSPKVGNFVELSPTEADLPRKAPSLVSVEGIWVTVELAVFRSFSIDMVSSSVSHSMVTCDVVVTTSLVTFLKSETHCCFKGQYKAGMKHKEKSGLVILICYLSASYEFLSLDKRLLRMKNGDRS